MSTREERNRLIELAKDTILSNEKEVDESVRDLLFLYDEASYSIENKIDALAGRFSEQNGLTQAAARELLEGREFTTWKMSMQEYLEQIPKSARGSRLSLELNTLAMKSRISREEQLLGEIYKNMANIAGKGGDGLRATLSDLYRTNYQRGMFNVQKAMRVGFNITGINEKRLLDILKFPWQTKDFSTALWDNVDTLSAHLRRELTLGFIKGSSVQEIARNINDTFDSGRYVAERLVRTECKYFANQGELEGYIANGIEKYRFIGGSESGHRCHCSDYNNTVIEVSKAKAGINYPPLHPNCLCIVVAEFSKSMFQERPDSVPLSENIKYKEWCERFAA